MRRGGNVGELKVLGNPANSFYTLNFFSVVWFWKCDFCIELSSRVSEPGMFLPLGNKWVANAYFTGGVSEGERREKVKPFNWKVIYFYYYYYF